MGKEGGDGVESFWGSPRTSEMCISGHCVEVEFTGSPDDPGTVILTDTKNRGGADRNLDIQPHIEVALSDWKSYIDGERMIGPQLPERTYGALAVKEFTDGSAIFTSLGTGVGLTYNFAEMTDFRHGVTGGDFTIPDSQIAA